jgi:hypothetical protein
VVPVTMTDDYPDHAIGIQPDGPHLILSPYQQHEVFQSKM